MPINRLLKDKRTPEEIELLNKAFNHALNLLGVVDRNDPLCVCDPPRDDVERGRQHVAVDAWGSTQATTTMVHHAEALRFRNAVTSVCCR
jgi:hypothetical protein